MKAKELREKSKEELEKMLGDLKKKLQKLRFDLAEKRLKNVREIRTTKRDIARVLTILKEKCQKKD
jgi:large subunit ribosomal protein L29